MDEGRDEIVAFQCNERCFSAPAAEWRTGRNCSQIRKRIENYGTYGVAYLDVYEGDEVRHSYELTTVGHIEWRPWPGENNG